MGLSLRALEPNVPLTTMIDEEKVPLNDDTSPVVSPADDEKTLPQWRPDRVVSPPTPRDSLVTGLCILLNTCATVAMVFLSKRSARSIRVPNVSKC